MPLLLTARVLRQYLLATGWVLDHDGWWEKNGQEIYDTWTEHNDLEVVRRIALVLDIVENRFVSDAEAAARVAYCGAADSMIANADCGATVMIQVDNLLGAAGITRAAWEKAGKSVKRT